MSPEFSRTYRIDTLGAGARQVRIDADEAERAALAARFGLLGIARLAAEAALSRTGETVTARGTVSAAVTQSCVATEEPVDETVEEAFRIEFRPHPESAAAEEEIELSEGEMDVVFYDGAAIDLGEALADTLALSLDPYPRSAGAEAVLREAGIMTEEEASPFAVLAQLKRGEP